MPDVLLGFDFGLRRIGVAVGQAITGSATPLETLLAQNGTPDWSDIQILIDTWHPEGLVVGLPFQMDGKEQAISFAARQFARTLSKRFGLPVYTMDERLTTREAKRQLSQLYPPTTQQPSLDSYAAKLIVEAWFSEQQIT